MAKFYAARMIERNPDAGYHRGTYTSPTGFLYAAGMAFPNHLFQPSTIYKVFSKGEADHLRTVMQPKFKHLPAFEVFEFATEGELLALIQSDAENLHKAGQPFVRANVLVPPKTSQEDTTVPPGHLAALSELGVENARLRTEKGIAQKTANDAAEAMTRMQAEHEKMKAEIEGLKKTGTPTGANPAGGSVAGMMDPDADTDAKTDADPDPGAASDPGCPACGVEVSRYSSGTIRRHKDPDGEWCKGE